jgi:kynurenine 3-monooxygenase
MPNVRIFFNHKLAGADFKRSLAWFEHRHQDLPPNPRGLPSRPTGKPGVTEVEVAFDFMIGADGAHSAARYHLMKFTRMSYQQEYIETMWCEFHVPARDTADGSEFRLSPNHLHIWPGGDDMFIAIPNTDRSFTATLFLPESRFEQLDRAHDAVLPSMFRTRFPGVVPELISEDEVVRQFRTNRHLPLISIKCHPYHYAASVVILGDAAHAMVPFYGQGMNAGMEDVLQLYTWLDRFLPARTGDPPPVPPRSDDPREAGADDLLASIADPSPEQRANRRAWALNMYTRERHPDAVAICDLALANYEEMSSHVTSPRYLLRKWVEERLHAYLPGLGWATQYTRVSFSTERYSVVRDEARRQQGRLRVAAAVAAAGIAVGIAVGVARASRR